MVAISRHHHCIIHAGGCCDIASRHAEQTIWLFYMKREDPFRTNPKTDEGYSCINRYQALTNRQIAAH